MTESISYILKLKDKYSKNLAKFQNQIAKSDFDIKKMSASINKLGKKIQQFGRGLRTNVTLPLLALGGASIFSFLKLEKGLVNTINLLDEADIPKFSGELEKAQTAAIKMGFSIDDTNEALFGTVSALGVGKQAFTAFEIAQKTAIAGNADLGVTIDGITSIMNAYGRETTNATEVANAFFSAQVKGKCLAKGTEVLMYDGNSKKVEDIIVGDKIMGDDNTLRNILKLGRGKEMMYKITMRDGSSYTVNESHILSLIHNNDYKKQKGVINISVKDFLQKSKKFQKNSYGYKPQKPLEFDNSIIPEYDAYLCGLWIADGRKDRISFSVNNKDIEIEKFLLNTAKNIDMEISYINIQENSKDINLKYSKNKILEYFKKVNVFKNKHIPSIWRTMPVNNRLEFLAGYLDGYGHVLNGNTICFASSSNNKDIINGITFIARSLGFSVSNNTRYRYDKRTDKTYTEHNLIIGGDIERIPTKLKRKKINHKTRKYDWNICSIKIEKLEVDDYYGFEIDGNRLFVLNDFNVTHNTTVAALASNIGKVSSIAKAVGVSFQETLATLSGLTLGGLSTEESTTALRAALTALKKPGKEAQMILKALGVPFGTVQIRALGLRKTLEKLAIASEKYPNALDKAIPNVNASTAVLALNGEKLKLIDEAMVKMNEDLKNGTGLMAGFERMNKTLSLRLARSKGQITILAKEIGSILAPHVIKLLEKIKLLIEKFQALDSNTKKNIVKFLIIAASIGPVLIVLGSLIAFIGTLITILPLLGTAIIAIGTAFGIVISPVLAVQVAIAALIATIIFLESKFKILKSITKWIAGIKSFFGGDIGINKDFNINKTTEINNKTTQPIPQKNIVDVSGLIKVMAEKGTTITQTNLFNQNLGLNVARAQ